MGKMHISVLREKTVDLLAVEPGGVYVDATLGTAGHTLEIIHRGGKGIRMLCIDRDPEALERSRVRLGDAASQCILVCGNSRDLCEIAEDNGITRINGMVLDAGCSSEQLDTAERGFSFQQSGPLDMRMGPDAGMTARELLDSSTETELAGILRQFGGERYAGRIARAILKAHALSPLETTGELAGIVMDAVGGRKGARIHPATRTFQAIRMAVNEELSSLKDALEAGITLLAPGGRISVITFHSGEHAVAKGCFSEHVGHWESLQQGGRKWFGNEPRLTWTAKRALRASKEECIENPRSRSAMLRGVQAVSEQDTLGD